MEIRFSCPALLPAFATQFLWANCLLMSASLLAQSPPMIATGWDSPTPARFRKNLSAFEALEIFDGTTIAPTRTLPSDRTVGCGHAFVDEPWQWADFEAELAASDGYIWIYGEQGQWWPGGKSRPSWEEKLPGATQALRLASDPIGTAMKRLSSIDRSENLLSNGEMEKVTKKGLPEGWFTWQEDYSHGTFAHQPSQATVTGVSSGVLGQNVAVEPGKTYLASAQLRSSGGGFFSITIG